MKSPLHGMIESLDTVHAGNLQLSVLCMFQ